MRALFFGTPAIAVPALEALVEIAEVPFVVCQPDRPRGRGLEVQPPPVKVRALELGLRVVQPEKIRTPEFAQELMSANVDVGLVIAYGRILPPAVLAAPRRGCMNLHASLLPRYRGAAPITWAIVRGEEETGISLMQMDEGCDTGAVFSRHAIGIPETMTADGLAAEIGTLAAQVVRHQLRRAVAGEIEAEPQDEAAATLAPMLKKEDGRIAWDMPVRQVHDHVRGMTSWPGAFTTSQGKVLKLRKTSVAPESTSVGPPGTVTRADAQGIEVACSPGLLRIHRAQLEGRKPLEAADLVRGRALSQGLVLGA